MRLTIIVTDNAVYKDGLCYSYLNFNDCGIPVGIHALQWQESSGWIEFADDRENQQIIQLPEWAVACVAKWDEKDYETKYPPAPTPEEMVADNEHKAKTLLRMSDWTQLPDVPLANKGDWETYRIALREIATQPTPDVVWPVEPLIIWS